MVQFHPVSKSEILELKEKERTDNSRCRLLWLLRLDIRKSDSRPHGSRKLIMTGRYNFYKVDFHSVVISQQKHKTNVLQINTLFYYFYHNKL